MWPRKNSESTQLSWEEGFLDHCNMFHFDSKASKPIKNLTSPSVRPRSAMGDGLCSYNRYSPWSKSYVVIDVTGIQDQMQPLW